jgi:hypothetical protein
MKAPWSNLEGPAKWLVIAVVVPVVFYPVSYTLWAAIDLVSRPLEPAARSDHRAHRFGRPGGGLQQPAHRAEFGHRQTAGPQDL